jgi:hypothetical protein
LRSGRFHVSFSEIASFLGETPWDRFRRHGSTRHRPTNLSALAANVTDAALRVSDAAGELLGLPYGLFTMSADEGILGVFSQRAFRADEKPLQTFGRALHFDGVRTDVRLRR